MGSNPEIEAGRAHDDAALQVGPMSAAERVQAAEVLARAFRDNPLNVAVIGSGDPALRVRCNLHGMRALLPVAQDHGLVLVARLDAGPAGLLVATPPYRYPLPPPPLGPRIRCLWRQGWRVGRRWAQVFRALDALHPPEPLAYLGTLGVEPALQGRGVGSALLEHWLAGLDGEATAAYLETDRIESVAFYERWGFQVLGETQVLGARIWRMRRPAATGRPARPVLTWEPNPSTETGG
jgi:ribosomal protein S18 acetylase RimI-like enzyme